MTVLTGTSAAEVLQGSTASNELTGGGGNDTFVFLRGQTDTVITDFGSTYFTAAISGAQEVPPNPSAGTGTFSGALNRTQTKFDFTADISNLDFFQQTPSTTDNIVAAHFHRAVPGVSGGIVYGFFGTPNNELDGETTINPVSGVVTGEWDAGEGNGTTLTAQAPFLLSNQLYINFHTTVLPAGEIRGQVTAIDTGQDRIDLRDTHIGDFATLQMFMRDVSGSVHITTIQNGQANTLILQGVPLSAVTASDFIFADATATTQTGGANADDLFGGAGADNLSGGGGADRLFAGPGNDTANGGDGGDSIFGQDGADSILGGAGDDSIQGNTGADSISGEDGADSAFGGKGDDVMQGNAGGDRLSGDIGNDSVSGGTGDDTVQGNEGADTVHGDDGADSVYGGKGADAVYGDAGADRISGDLGADLLFGGAGGDRFAFARGFGSDWVGDFNFAEGDRILLAPGTTYTATAYLGQAVLDLGSGDTIGLAGVSSTSFTADWVVFG